MKFRIEKLTNPMEQVGLPSQMKWAVMAEPGGFQEAYRTRREAARELEALEQKHPAVPQSLPELNQAIRVLEQEQTMVRRAMEPLKRRECEIGDELRPLNEARAKHLVASWEKQLAEFETYVLSFQDKLTLWREMLNEAQMCNSNVTSAFVSKLLRERFDMFGSGMPSVKVMSRSPDSAESLRKNVAGVRFLTSVLSAEAVDGLVRFDIFGGPPFAAPAALFVALNLTRCEIRISQHGKRPNVLKFKSIEAALEYVQVNYPKDYGAPAYNGILS